VKRHREASFFEAFGFVANYALRFCPFDEIGDYVAKYTG
jgi:hypothetical protein